MFNIADGIKTANILQLANKAYVAANGGNNGYLKFPKWAAAVNGARAGVRPAKLLIMGDSNTVGQGSGSTTGVTGGARLTGARPFSYPQVINNKLSKTVFQSSSDSFFGDMNIGTSTGTVGLNLYDPRLVFGAGWGINGFPTSLGGAFIQGTDATAGTFAFTPLNAWDTVDVFYIVTGGAQTALQVSINGTLKDTVNLLGTNAVLKKTYTAGSLAVQPITFKGTTTGTSLIAGVVCRNSTKMGIEVYQAGWGGAVSFDLGGGVAPWSPENFSSGTLQPDLTILQVTVNDLTAQTPASSFQYNLQYLVPNALATGDLLMVVGIPSNVPGTTNGLLDQYKAVMQGYASSQGGTVVDLRTIFGPDWTTMSNRGYVFDAYHPNASGYQYEGGYLADQIYVP